MGHGAEECRLVAVMNEAKFSMPKHTRFLAVRQGSIKNCDRQFLFLQYFGFMVCRPAADNKFDLNNGQP